MRIVFMGSPALAVPILEALPEAGHELSCVYTAPPRKAGRGRRLRQTPVQEWAEQHGLTVRCPQSLKAAEEQLIFAALHADIALVIAYGLILPVEILEAPRLGCLNLHGSALPRWRGAAPVQRAIMAGDSQIALQVMRMQAGLDTGPIMLSHPLPLSETDTAGDVLARMGDAGAGLAVQALALMAEGKANFTPQMSEGVTYAHKITPEETRIDWTRPADAVRHQIHGLSPVPGGWCEADGVRLKILRVVTDMRVSGDPGQVLDEALLIGCASGAVRVIELQRPGKSAMPVGEFLRGFPVPAGTRLG